MFSARSPSPAPAPSNFHGGESAVGAATTRAASARLILRSRDGRLFPPTRQKCPPLSARRDRLPESARSAGTGGSRAGGPPTWFHGPRHRLCERGCARGAGRADVEAGGGSRGHEQRRPAGGAHAARVPSGRAPRSLGVIPTRRGSIKAWGRGAGAATDGGGRIKRILARTGFATNQGMFQLKHPVLYQ